MNGRTHLLSRVVAVALFAPEKRWVFELGMQAQGSGCYLLLLTVPKS